MSKLWTFMRGFSATKYYQAALGGSLSLTPPYSFGGIFVLGPTVTGGQQTIFGNAVFNTSGFGMRYNSSGNFEVAAGTVTQTEATALADADNTYGTTPEGDLLNNYKSYLQRPGAAVGGQLAWPRARNMHLVHVFCHVPASGSQLTFVNGSFVASTAVANVVNANPVRIGVDASAANPAVDVWVAGLFYDSGAITGDEFIQAFYQSCIDTKDLVPDLYGVTNAYTPDYMWSVKRNGYNAPTNWASFGEATTPINMVKQGVTPFNLAGSNANLLAVSDVAIAQF